MAAIDEKESKEAQQIADIEYSKLDITSPEHQRVLTLHAGNYDIDHMNWKQIEYDALYEGCIIRTYKLIQEWMNAFDKKANSDASDDKLEYAKYMKIKKEKASLINEISIQYNYCQLAHSQLCESHTNNNSNSKSSNKKEEAWISQVDNHDGISVYYRKEANTPIHSIKVSFRCKGSPLEFLTVINEFDLIVKYYIHCICIFLFSFFFDASF